MFKIYIQIPQTAYYVQSVFVWQNSFDFIVSFSPFSQYFRKSRVEHIWSTRFLGCNSSRSLITVCINSSVFNTFTRTFIWRTSRIFISKHTQNKCLIHLAMSLSGFVIGPEMLAFTFPLECTYLWKALGLLSSASLFSSVFFSTP